MEAKLVVVGGESRVSEVQLKLPTVIGRGRNAKLTLPHPLVSRQHCEIYEDSQRLMINDLGSLNGTFVGDQRITHPTPLMPGDLLTVGTVTFRAVYEISEDAPEVETTDAEATVFAANVDQTPSTHPETPNEASSQAETGPDDVDFAEPLDDDFDVEMIAEEDESAVDDSAVMVDFEAEPSDDDRTAKASGIHETETAEPIASPDTMTNDSSDTADLSTSAEEAENEESLQAAPDDDDLATFLKGID